MGKICVCGVSTVAEDYITCVQTYVLYEYGEVRYEPEGVAVYH